MTFQIREADGSIWTVSTEVGDGLARVVVEQDEAPEESIEPGEEA